MLTYSSCSPSKEPNFNNSSGVGFARDQRFQLMLILFVVQWILFQKQVCVLVAILSSDITIFDTRY
jgi:hypothetical protein